jgi:hypothetical protein
MRKSAGFAIPLSVIIVYYAFWVVLTSMLLSRFPAVVQYLPFGGISELASEDLTSFEPVYTSVGRTVLDPGGPIRLALASLGSVILIIPVSWAYFITSRSGKIDQSFIQTIVILPVVVTGIAMIVLNSLALAFSLAGIVAAVRFRFSLAIPSDAMYIFVAIGIGLGAGIGAVGVAMVISFAFVITTLVIWRLQYGKTASGPFLRMMARRESGDDDF